MDRYAHRLHDWLESSDFGFRVQLAAHVGALTRDSAGRRGSAGDKRSNRRKGFVRWWTQPVDPSRVVLPGPLRGPQSYAARYYFYPWRVKREAKRADVVHVLDHSYAHMIEKAGRRPVVVTVHDLMPVVVLRSPTDGWREGVRNRFLRQALKALRQADSYIVGTEWLFLGRLRSEKPAVVWPDLTLDRIAEQLERLHREWPRELGRTDVIEYVNSKGEKWSSRADDILMHVVIHGAYHRGQIATLVRQSGATPAYTDYIHCIRSSFLVVRSPEEQNEERRTDNGDRLPED